MKRKVTILAGLLIATTLTLSAFYGRGADEAPMITAESVTRGSVVTTVAASGTLEAVTTVQVGSQVSGTVNALYADFNSIVRKGQVLARLDPSLYTSAIEQAQANLVKAQADHERIRVSLEDAEAKLRRATELAARQLIPANELDTAEVNRASIEAQLRSSGASVSQARASLEQARVNLAKTVITSPIDGIVISRNVDVGQTVAASLSAPNPELKLKPGMTANLTIEVARRDDVLRAPAAAVRFRPTAETLTALGAPSAPAGGRAHPRRPTRGGIAPVPVRTGISDGTWTEIVDGALSEGTQLVTRVALIGNSSTASRASSSGNPLMGTQQQRR